MPATTHGARTAAAGRVASQTQDSAIARGLAVLELLALEAGPVRLADVAQRLGLQKSTAHRTLTTLSALGYVERATVPGCYQASLRLWEIGSDLAAHHPVKRAATEFIRRLHQSTRETVSLVILSGDDVLYLDKLISPRPIRFTSRVGTRAPAALTAGGKAILAYERDARAMLDRTLARVEPKLRLSPDTFARMLQDVRRKGYASSSFRSGVISFAAPIMARDGRAAAAISVSAPISRMTDAKRAQIVEQLLATCAEIAERVGHL
jgi:DNA-binding IclR family transcriptional regulator